MRPLAGQPLSSVNPSAASLAQIRAGSATAHLTVSAGSQHDPEIAAWGHFAETHFAGLAASLYPVGWETHVIHWPAPTNGQDNGPLDGNAMGLCCLLHDRLRRARFRCSDDPALHGSSLYSGVGQSDNGPGHASVAHDADAAKRLEGRSSWDADAGWQN